MCFHTLNNCLPFGKSTFGKGWPKSAVWGLTGVYPRENGFSVIRILQEDVFKNKYDWLQELTNNIEITTNEYRVQNVFMCKNDEYKDYL